MPSKEKIISDDIFKAYLNCQYKSYLKLYNNAGQKTEFEESQEHLNQKYRSEAIIKLKNDYPENTIFTIPELNRSIFKKRGGLIGGKFVKIENFQSSFDALFLSPGDSINYTPVLSSRYPKLDSKIKHRLAFNALVIGRLQEITPTHGYIIYGEKFKTKKIPLKSHIEKVKGIVTVLKQQIVGIDDIPFFLNAHCEICEFAEICRAKAVEVDHLSLLRSMSAKEIQKQNQKGIFT
ncbi:MAG: hypothetical protein KAK04_17630, partial [Cyclobacteriaceae bacterium]|nr:hypothetical protein [Cyclobacteriaceae bacterium]